MRGPKTDNTAKERSKARKAQEIQQEQPAVRKLTARQERFVLEYLIDFNGTRAAIRAGYSPRTASEIGYQLLQKTSVQREITRLRQSDAERLGITREKALKELAVIGFSDIRQIVRSGGGLLPLEELPDSIAGAVSTYEKIDNITDQVTTIRRRVRLWDKPNALEKLGKHLGLFNGHDEQKDKEADKRLLIVINEQKGPQINVTAQGEKPPGEAVSIPG